MRTENEQFSMERTKMFCLMSLAGWRGAQTNGPTLQIWCEVKNSENSLAWWGLFSSVVWAPSMRFPQQISWQVSDEYRFSSSPSFPLIQVCRLVRFLCDVYVCGMVWYAITPLLHIQFVLHYHSIANHLLHFSNTEFDGLNIEMENELEKTENTYAESGFVPFEDN